MRFNELGHRTSDAHCLAKHSHSGKSLADGLVGNFGFEFFDGGVEF
jgi:hypothetical protein